MILSKKAKRIVKDAIRQGRRCYWCRREMILPGEPGYYRVRNAISRRGATLDHLYGFHHPLRRDPQDWHWGTRTKVWWYPWTWSHYRHSLLKPDGSLWHTLEGIYDYGALPTSLKEQHRYNYLMHDGTVQTCTATVNGEEREWRLKCASWLPWPRMIKRTINVQFSEEMGPRRGSWKGGVVGTGHEWRKNETMQQALRRMERERVF